MRGRCVSALPAADFESLLERPSESVLDADLPAAVEVCFSGAFRCDNALPAADLDFADVDELESVFDALVAAGLEVTSFLATRYSLLRSNAGNKGTDIGTMAVPLD